uniref:Single-pass membrane and coiled-coil domain-containing protein 4 n=1 Tax=Gopherus agassizii TaxID=38772 RepID=A0A452ITK8_9SAUR
MIKIGISGSISRVDNCTEEHPNLEQCWQYVLSIYWSLRVWHRQPFEVARTVTPLFKDLPWPISWQLNFCFVFCFGGGTTKEPKRRMRQLKGKPKKETSRDKKERKQAMQEARQQITTVVLPTMAVVVLLIVVFVYVATRPNTTE